MSEILLVDDETAFRNMTALLLKDAGHRVTTASDAQTALQILAQKSFPLMIFDLCLPDKDGLFLLQKVRERHLLSEVLVLTGHGSIDTAVKAMKKGAYDYLVKPINPDNFLVVVEKALEKYRLKYELKRLKNSFKQNIIARSTSMRQILSLMEQVAPTNAPVLITGESGTGKELIAQGIHQASQRRDKPFITVNCAALSNTLLESELFGYVKGAFTGATKEKKGIFEEANQGTVFLDEIGETSPNFQVKLLRVLQQGEVKRVGDAEIRKVNVRIIAATNKDLDKEIIQGNFRKDLYYRLQVIMIHIPPLRERKEDILPLALHFLDKYQKKYQKKLKFHPDTLDFLESYPWPGNVRELENAVERAVIVANGPQINIDDLGLKRTEGKFKKDNSVPSICSLAEVEKRHILNVLSATKGNKRQAARILKIGYNTLWRKLKKYQIDKA